jgi:TPR repeat protein
MKRVKADDPVALYSIGFERFREGDNEGGVEYWTKAAELGYAQAHYGLSVMYHRGDIEENDTKKEIYHLEEAAIGGHPDARYNLGCKEVKNGRFERARKHFIIAANLGEHNALEGLKKLYANGYASKEEYASALRGYQAAVDATKSEQREEVYRVQRQNRA